MSAELARAYLDRHPEEVAELLAAADPGAVAAFACTLPAEALLDLLQRLPPDPGAAIVDALDRPQAGALLARLTPGTAARMLARLPEARRRALVDVLPRAFAHMVQLRLRHPAGTVGAVMEPAPASLPADDELPAARARALLRGALGRVLPVIYTLDARLRPAGAVPAAALACAADEAPIGALALPAPPSLRARASLISASASPGWAQLDHLPVVDSGDAFVGVLARLELERALAAEGGDAAGPDLVATAIALADILWRPGARLLAEALVPALARFGSRADE